MASKEVIPLPRKNWINTRFSQKEQLLVIKAFLMQINLGVERAEKVSVKVRGFGHIHSHMNKKSPKQRYNAAWWQKKKKEMKKKKEFNVKKLLF